MLSRAIEIAAKAHKGQVDKGGKPYIFHPLRVLLHFAEDEENVQICAVLHDVVEDTPVTLNDLCNEGFSGEVVSALDCLTRRAGESYDDFIDRIIINPIARKVKLADLNDNMDLTRISAPTARDLERVEKYKLAINRLISVR